MRRSTPTAPPAPKPRLGGLEEQYHLLMEEVSDRALLILDPEGCVAAWNSGRRRFFGYREEEIVGRHWAVFFTPQDQARGLPQKELRAAVEMGEEGQDHWWVRKDATWLWCSGRLKVLLHDDGTLRGFARVLSDQTQARLREEELGRARERFQLAAAAVDGMLYDADLATGSVDRGEGLLLLTGYHPEEAEPTTAWWVERIHPDDWPRWLTVRAALQANPAQRLQELEYRVRHKDGRYLLILDRALILRDDSGRPMRLVGCAFDISKRRHAEEALRESEERHRIISELTSDYNYTLRVDPDGSFHLDSVSEAFTRVTGYPLDELNARGGWQILIHPEDRPIAQQGSELILAGQASEGVLRLVTREGAVRWIRFLNRPFRDESQGRVIRIIGAAQDISEQKHAVAALRESEERFQAFMNNGPSVAWMKNEELRYVYVNKPYEQLIRKRLAECLGRTDFDLWPPQVAHQLREADQAVLASGRVLEATEGFADPDGRFRHWLVYKFPFTNAAGQRFVGGLAIDITDRRRVEKEARESRERLQILSRQLIATQENERRRLARELHDEIGQTLTAISINLQVVRIKDGQPGPGHAALEEALAIVDRTIRQVRQLSLDLRPSLLDDLGLEPALRWYANRQIQRTGLVIRLHTNLADGRLPVELETACFRLTQEALTNVVRHARARQVWIELRQRRDALVLVVRDDGAGFDPSEVRQRTAEGASLGLLGMRERVELLGGTLAIESQPGKGTCIAVQLPLAEAAGRKPSGESEPEGWRPSASTGTQQREAE